MNVSFLAVSGLRKADRLRTIKALRNVKNDLMLWAVNGVVIKFILGITPSMNAIPIHPRCPELNLNDPIFSQRCIFYLQFENPSVSPNGHEVEWLMFG